MGEKYIFSLILFHKYGACYDISSKTCYNLFGALIFCFVFGSDTILNTCELIQDQ